MRRCEQRILRDVIVVPGQHRRTAVAGTATAVDAGMQYGDCGQRRRQVVRRCGRMTDVAGSIAWIRHMPDRQRVAVPVGRGVAEAAVVRRDHLPCVVIGRANLQEGARSAHIEARTRFVAGVAGGRHERMFGLSHVHRPEGADRVGARGVAGTAVGTGEIWNVGRRQHRVLGREIVGPGQRGYVVAVAQTAVAADAGVQDGVRREGSRRVIAGSRRMACAAGQVARIRHVPDRHRVADPVLGGVAHGTVAGGHARIAAVDVIGRPQLQRRAAPDVEALAGVMAGVAGRAHERVLGGAHRRCRAEAAGLVGRAVTGAAIGAGEDRDVRRRERSFLGGRHAGNRHWNIRRRHARKGLTAVAQHAIAHVQSRVQHRNARGQDRPGFRRRRVAVTNAAVDGRRNRRNVIRRLSGDEAGRDLHATAMAGLAGRYRHLRVIETGGRPGGRRGAQAGGVAALARIGGGHVIALLAHGFDAVVTGRAARSDARVIEVGTEPGGGEVAVAAFESRCDVARILAGGLHAVVADDAEALHRQRDLRVIDRLRRIPAHDRVAGFARVIGLWVNFWVLALGNGAVVAADAASHHFGVSEVHRGPE